MRKLSEFTANGAFPNVCHCCSPSTWVVGTVAPTFLAFGLAKLSNYYSSSITSPKFLKTALTSSD
tara:strand:+ start:256 stop:450 length:195 start_codon:yes stop_codon:yes gene_type:complete